MSKEKKIVSVKTLNESLQNVIKTLNPNIGQNILKDLKKYQNSDLTKDIVEDYFKMFEMISEQTNNMNIDENNKNEILKAFSILVSLMGQNECISSVLMATKEEKETYKKYSNDLLDRLKEINIKYNKLANKYNESTIELELPKIELNLVRKNKKLPVTTDDIIEIAKNIGDMNLEEKYKRFSKKNVLDKEDSNLTHIYAKRSDKSGVNIK